MSIGTETTWGWLSSDGGSYSFGTANLGAITTPTAAIMPGVFRANDDGTAPEWLSRPIDGIAPKLPEGSPNSVQQGIYANDAANVLAFQSLTPLTGEAPSEGTSAVYVSVAGRLELASKLPDGSVPTESSSLVCGSGASLTHPSLLLPYCSALIFEMIVGRRPFAGGTPYEMASNILTNRRTRMESLLDGPIREVIDRCMCIDPAGRYASVRELSVALRQLRRRNTAKLENRTDAAV